MMTQSLDFCVTQSDGAVDWVDAKGDVKRQSAAR